MAPLTLKDAQALDQADPLRDMRGLFHLPPDTIYLDGNSLGALPRATLTRLAEVAADEWGQSLIRSWTGRGWLEAPARIGGKIARLIGAGPGEVIVADSTSVNLFKLIVAGLRLRPGRHVVLTEAGNFPTDLHIAEGAAACVPGAHVQAVPTDNVLATLRDDTAMVVLTHVHYRSGARHDMAAITRAAHAAGALMLWDLSHSTGAIPVDLAASGADFAVGCGYKYLNGGPGAPAFLFVAERHQAGAETPLQGWMGHADPFGFADAYRPAEGVARFLCGTPPILSFAALETGVDLMLSADRAAIKAKSARLFDLFAAQAAPLAARHRLNLLTPSDPAARGSHIAFSHPQAALAMQALIARGVIGDYRTPDVLRFGLTPLYLGFEDVVRAVRVLGDVLSSL